MIIVIRLHFDTHSCTSLYYCLLTNWTLAVVVGPWVRGWCHCSSQDHTSRGQGQKFGLETKAEDNITACKLNCMQAISDGVTPGWRSIRTSNRDPSTENRRPAPFNSVVAKKFEWGSWVVERRLNMVGMGKGWPSRSD